MSFSCMILYHLFYVLLLMRMFIDLQMLKIMEFFFLIKKIGCNSLNSQLNNGKIKLSINSNRIKKTGYYNNNKLKNVIS